MFSNCLSAEPFSSNAEKTLSMESEQRYLIKILVCAGSECAEDGGADALAARETCHSRGSSF